MAEIWAAAVAAVGVGAGLYESNQSKQAAKGAANQQAQAAANANNTQLQMYNQTRSDLQPYAQAGTNALSQMQAANNGDYSAFYNDPSYKFAQSQGISGMDASAAARGNLYSGGYSKDLATFNNALAGNQYNSYATRLQGLINTGESAAAGQGSAGQSYANAYGQNVTNAGNAQAAGIINGNNAQANGINQATNALGQYASSYQNRQNSFNDPNSPNYIPPVNPDYSVNPDLNFNYG